MINCTLLVILRRPFDGVVVQPSVLGGEHVQLLGVTQATGRKIGIDFGEHYRHGGESGGRLTGQIGTWVNHIWISGKKHKKMENSGPQTRTKMQSQ